MSTQATHTYTHTQTLWSLNKSVTECTPCCFNSFFAARWHYLLNEFWLITIINFYWNRFKIRIFSFLVHTFIFYNHSKFKIIFFLSNQVLFTAMLWVKQNTDKTRENTKTIRRQTSPFRFINSWFIEYFWVDSFTEMEKYEDLLVDSKRTISKWEYEFQKTNGRKPSKVQYSSFVVWSLQWCLFIYLFF